ncbi:hypothetical protein [Comamonas koreensis]|uniref:Meckel syndrome type 1 protein n=1 Tax=Comamonas koreensis TaxID=160825 RepID=A0AAW4XWH1_9BURK|nr:hypothetical protein [Comamonas koreensis]MCD2165021.1 hypothetical protein [Comamonas koreensis]
MTAPQDPKRPDALVDLYREASAQDAGPSDASTAQILAHARAKAAQGPASTPSGLDSSGRQGQQFQGEAANDRRWWLQALGSLAAIGLVSWLALQHLHEPGAPQLEAPQMDSAPSAASAPPTPGAPVAPAADRAASPDSAKMRSEAAPMGKAASPATKEAPATAPAAAAGAGASSANIRPAPAIAPAPQAERRMPSAAAPTPVAPPVLAPAAPAGPAAAPAARKQAAEQPAAPMAAAPPASEAASALAAAATLPACGTHLDAQALAEQRRRIQAYDKALAAGLPAPAPAPLCRPAPAHEAEPAQPVDSR